MDGGIPCPPREPKKTIHPGKDTYDLNEALLLIIIKKEEHVEVLASPTTTYGKKKNAAYRPLTGQFVCPDHPMQKPLVLWVWVWVCIGS